MTPAKKIEDLIKRRWSAEEDEILRRLWPNATRPEILAALPGRTAGTCSRRAFELGVKCLSRKHLAKVVSPVIERDGVRGKACVACLEWKPLEKFARHDTCADGRRNKCTTCEGRWRYKHHRLAAIKTVRRWQASHPDQHAVNQHRGRIKRQFREEVQGPGITSEEVRELFGLYRGFCAYCLERRATCLDHMTPLSRGGVHGRENLIPACMPCNQSKGSKTVVEFAEYQFTNGET